ncbi:hypothetical protein BVRB_028950 [Beta vulgaris subsp. vulgaris]|uniref:Uncharacterized protein n=1 Tax=Beta vulgaris subsp. vulgaris TaxID=3555 RepID=A0A0J8AXX9_BETVV|nr:hypothetical protein BVRB_028950 [Beta vulgaris subsp. vulgaris]
MQDVVVATILPEWISIARQNLLTGRIYISVMSDDDFLELFSNFLTSIRIHDVGDSKRHAILHEAEGALCSIMSNNGIVASLEKQPSRASGSDGSISDSDRRVLEKIGRAILTEHPDHLKMREILELLDGDKDGFVMIGADNLFF